MTFCGKMGELGLLGIRYPSCYGGASSAHSLPSCSQRSSKIKLRRVQRDCAGAYGHGFASSRAYWQPAQLDRYMPAVIAGEKITAAAVTGARRRL